MLKILTTTLLAIVFVAGCSSKKKPDVPADGLVDGAQMNTSDVVDRDLKLDPMGSDSGTIGGLSTVHFPYDSSNLTEETKAALAQNAQWIKNNPGVTMQIEGHCDAKGSDEYNRSLGARRAEVVKAYLKGLGVEATRLTTLSWGEEKLIALGDSDADNAKNRRANFVPSK